MDHRDNIGTMSSVNEVRLAVRLRSLARVVVVLVAILAAVVLMASTQHADVASAAGPGVADAPSAAAAGSIPLGGGGDDAHEVVASAIAGVAVGCVSLAICCLLALFARRVSARAPVLRVSTFLTVIVRALAPRPSVLRPDLHHLSISRT